MPGIVFTNEHGLEIQDATEGSEQGLHSAQGTADGANLDWGLSAQAGSDCSGSEYETADEWAEHGGQNGGWASAEEEPVSVGTVGLTVEGATEQPSLDESTEEQGSFSDWGVGDQVDPFQTQTDPFQTQTDPFQTQTDPFQTQTDPFQTQIDPLQTQADPFQTQADEENAGPACETLFQVAEPAVPSTVTVPMVQSTVDPFQGADVFADPHVDPFAQAGCAELVLDFVSDPFAEPLGGGGWASDPFASDGSQLWPENWAPAAGGENWAFPGASEGQPNGFVQWGAFPGPAASGEGGAAGSDSPWQEVCGTIGFFSSGDQGELTASRGHGDQDPSAALPGGPGQGENKANDPLKGRHVPPGAKLDARGSRINTIEAAPGHKDTENSDLSEDEATNRRYGKLYQEVDTEKEEVPSTLSSPPYIA
ncbi:hypothetical protein SKAU_G00380920 [Synaphobranchus kaupii]|uniref:Uncharacterized protein n=1 Tax=Synaphobranchus kaupii TaxID=118154 RepID=A0A9Q1IEN2_SYNKA|nr:hypothetical protein SKAU_G00380920 [Synaphobranchus kaupii]